MGRYALPSAICQQQLIITQESIRALICYVLKVNVGKQLIHNISPQEGIQFAFGMD